MAAEVRCLYNRCVGARFSRRIKAMVRLIQPAQYQSMPWKNGGGETTEIAAHPPGSALDTFAWRVSIAKVDRDGPFSRFPGIDRTIVLLDGAGMRLRGTARDVMLRAKFEPYAFDGDDTIACTLVAGTIHDFNAMFRRGRAVGSVNVVRGGDVTMAPAAFRLVYAATGAHACDIPGRPALTLGTHETLLIGEAADAEHAPIAIRPLAGNAVALAVRIECP
jgi:uncharacterized protein